MDLIVRGGNAGAPPVLFSPSGLWFRAHSAQRDEMKKFAVDESRGCPPARLPGGELVAKLEAISSNRFLSSVGDPQNPTTMRHHSRHHSYPLEFPHPHVSVRKIAAFPY